MTTKKESKKVSKNVPKKVSKKVSKKISKKNSKKVQKKLSRKVSKKLSNKVLKKVSKKVSKNTSKKPSKKISKKVREMIEMSNSSESVWGKNKPLEKFWQGLASGKYVVVIYKNGKHEYVKLPKPNTQKSTTLFNEFDANDEIEAVLSSSRSTDSYTEFLYPKVKNNSVEYVIKNYKKIFESFKPNKYTPADKPLMKKVMLI